MFTFKTIKSKNGLCSLNNYGHDKSNIIRTNLFLKNSQNNNAL